MTKGTYLPRKDKDKSIWLNNFAGKFAGVATTLGFATADVTAVNNDALMFSYMVNLVETFSTEKEERVEYKNLIRSGAIGSAVGAFPAMPTLQAPPTAVPAGIFLRIAQMTKRIKNHPNYTEAIGKDLGIIGAEQILDTAAMKPLLKLVSKGGVVEVQWPKGVADAIRIEVDRDGKGFQFLTIDTVPHYTDTAPITAPGTWKYKAMYLISDEPVGQWSDEVGIRVG